MSGENRMDLRPRKGSVSLKEGQEQTLVVNEFLAFAFDEMKRTPKSDLKCTMIKFYSANSIAEAKRLLWEKYSSSLTKMSSHMDTAKRLAAEADLDDVLEAVENIDSKTDGCMKLHTIFVARDLRNLPPLPSQMPPYPTNDVQTANDIAEIREKLNNIEREMGNIGDLVGDALAQERNQEMHHPRFHPSSPSYAQVVTAILPSDDSTIPKAYEAANFVALATAAPIGKKDNENVEDGDGDFIRVRGRRERRRHKRAQEVTDAAKSQSTKPRSRKTREIVGTRRDTALKAGTYQLDVFVYRVAKEVSEEAITKFLTDGGVTPVVLEMMPSRENAHAKSFHAKLECTDARVKSAEFWPDGWCCRPWYPRRNDGDVNKKQ